MFTQVLQRQPVLRQRLLLPYVPLLDAGRASVPAMKILNGEVLHRHQDLQCLFYIILELFSQFRIQQIAESITNEVSPHSHCKDCQSRESCHPEFIEVLNTIRYHHTPFRCWRSRTQTKEAQCGEHQDLITDIRCRHDQNRSNTVWNDFL